MTGISSAGFNVRAQMTGVERTWAFHPMWPNIKDILGPTKDLPVETQGCALRAANWIYVPVIFTSVRWSVQSLPNLFQ